MSDNNDIRRGRHCVFKMHVHLVFVAKYRRKVFDGDAIDRLRIIFAKTCANFEAQLIEMDGEDDHVHLLVEYPPKVAVSHLVNSLKGVSSRLLRKERPDIQNATGAASCGLLPTSHQAAAARRLASSANTLSSRRLQLNGSKGVLRTPRYPSPA